MADPHRTSQPVPKRAAAEVRAQRVRDTFSLRSKTGRIGLMIIVVALTLIITPLLLPRLLPPPAKLSSDAAADPWPTAPATYVAPVAPPAVDLRSVPTPIPLPAPQWREMNHLTVIEFQQSTVAQVERRADVAFLGEVVTDRLLLKATGNIQMAIDLGQVRDVVIDDTTIRFTAPKPQIISVELLPEKSQIYDSVQVIFLSNYSGLETEALDLARQQLRAEIAANPSMTELAEEFARLKLTEFLEKVGYTTVDVTFVEGEVVP
jgi:hypothetical protein